MIGLPFLPRSPRWLAKVGREEEAIQTLADIQAGGNKDDPLVIAEWEEIYTVLAAERESVRGWKKFFVNGMWKRTLAGMSVQAWQVSPLRISPLYIRITLTWMLIANERRECHRLLYRLRFLDGRPPGRRQPGFFWHSICDLHHVSRLTWTARRVESSAHHTQFHFYHVLLHR